MCSQSGIMAVNGDSATTTSSMATMVPPVALDAFDAPSQCSSKYDSIKSCPTCAYLAGFAADVPDSLLMMPHRHQGLRSDALGHNCEGVAEAVSGRRARSPCSSDISFFHNADSSSSSSSSVNAAGTFGPAAFVALIGVVVAVFFGAVHATSAANDHDASSRLTMAFLLAGGTGSACEAFAQWRAVWSQAWHKAP